MISGALFRLISSFSYFIVAVSPLPWWYTSIGGVINVYDSPFFVNVYYMEQNLSCTLVYPINLLLISLRLAEVFTSIVYSFSSVEGIVKGKIPDTPLFTFYVSLFYLLDLILFSVIDYFMIGKLIAPVGAFKENVSLSRIPFLNLNGDISAEITNYPLPMFYVTLASGLFSLVTAIVSNDERKITRR